MDFEKRRSKIIQFYESVKHAQTVQIDDIPLPQMSEQPASNTNSPSAPNRTPVVSILPNIELPLGVQQPFTMPGLTAANQRKRPLDNVPAVVDDRHSADTKSPPGCPPGPPPDLCKLRELDSDYEDDNYSIRPTSKFGPKLAAHFDTDRDVQVPDNKANDVDVPKPTSLQQRILAIAGQKYDDFMKELENVHKINKSKSNTTTDSDRNTASDNDNESSDAMLKSSESFSKKPSEEHFEDGILAPQVEQMMMPRFDNESSQMPHQIMVPPIPQMLKLPSGPPPPPMGMPPTVMYRPPPIRPGHPGMGLRLPPAMPRMRMPPGPPTSMPPNRMMHGHHKPPHLPPPLMHNTLSAAPQLIKDTKGMTTITAKPQIRNLSADVTRFVPSALRVKREEKKISRPKPYVSEYRKQSEATVKGTTKDDAYMQFMREMQGLL